MGRRIWGVSAGGGEYVIVRRQDLKKDEDLLALARGEASMRAEEWSHNASLRRTLVDVDQATVGLRGGQSPNGVIGRLRKAFEAGDLLVLKTQKRRVVVIKDAKDEKPALGPDEAPPVTFYLDVYDYASTRLEGIDLVYTIEGAKHPAKTDGSGMSKVENVHGATAKVSPKDEKALRDKLAKLWEKPLHATPYPQDWVMSVEDFKDISLSAGIPKTVVLAPYDVLVRFPYKADYKKLPHELVLESQDGSIKQTRKMADATRLLETIVEVWFTNVKSTQKYKLTCKGGPAPVTLFDFTPYKELAKSGTKDAPGKLPLEHYYPE